MTTKTIEFTRNVDGTVSARTSIELPATKDGGELLRDSIILSGITGMASSLMTVVTWGDSGEVPPPQGIRMTPAEVRAMRRNLKTFGLDSLEYRLFSVHEAIYLAGPAYSEPKQVEGGLPGFLANLEYLLATGFLEAFEVSTLTDEFTDVAREILANQHANLHTQLQAMLVEAQRCTESIAGNTSEIDTLREESIALAYEIAEHVPTESGPDFKLDGMKRHQQGLLRQIRDLEDQTHETRESETYYAREATQYRTALDEIGAQLTDLGADIPRYETAADEVPQGSFDDAAEVEADAAEVEADAAEVEQIPARVARA